MHVAAFHPLTPGNPAYALVKVGAIGGLFAVRYAMTRRKRRPEEAEEHEAPEPAAHPVSARKAKRRRKRRP